MQRDDSKYTKFIVRQILSLCIFVSLMLLTSCEKILFTQEGNTIEKIETYEYFSQLIFYDIFEVELKTDTVFSIQLAAKEKFIENISMSEDSGAIEFRDANFARWMPDYPRPRLLISLPRLDGNILTRSPIKLTSPDTLKLEKLNLVILGKTGEFDLTIDVNNFRMVSGSDDFEFFHFKGKANNASFWPRGSSKVDAEGLICKDCYVYNNSIGDCNVNVTHKLTVRLNTIGNVIYSGNPAEIVIDEESGSGGLIPSGND